MFACDANDALLKIMTEKYGVPTSSNWSEALPQVDAVAICTPAPLHVPIALQALRQGRHTLIEKPLSHALENVDELLRVARESRARSAVAYVFHVYPILVAARDFIRRGGIGEVRQVTIASGQPFHRLRPAYARTYYRDRRSGGGAIQDALTHTVNWVESVIGPTDSVVCDCAHQVLPDVEVEDTVHIAARNGRALVSYALNQFQSPKENTIQFNAAAGSVRVEFQRHRWGALMEKDADWTWHENPVPDQDAHFVAQAHAFLDQIEGQPARLCTLEAAAQTLRFNLAALASSERNTRVFCQELHA